MDHAGPELVYTDLTYQQHFRDFLESGQMFDNSLATDNPNLRAFRAAGGKLIMWQGSRCARTPTRTRSTPAGTPTWPPATPAAAGHSSPTRCC